LQKNILILGAGIFQLPGIRKACELGFHVITLDNLPNNPGHKLSHQNFNCSTTNLNGVLQIAEKLQIDAICTFSSDVAIPTVGYVCDELGLKGISYHVANTMTNKHLFRTFMQERDLASLGFVFGKDFKTVYKKIKELSLPIMFKPVDSSGSRGLTKLSTYESRATNLAFEKAKDFSRSGVVCIEEFMDGKEVGGDGFLIDGHLEFITITHKYMNNFVVTGHRLPGSIKAEYKQSVITALEQCCQNLGYRNGPLNFDVIVGKNQVGIIEISARNGGNGIPSIIKHAVGLDVELATLKYVLGEKLDFFLQKTHIVHGCGSLVFGSPFPGVMKNISNFKALRRKVPQVVDLQLAKKCGDVVDTFNHNGNLIGYVLFECSDHKEYIKNSKKIMQTLNMKIIY
jgi:biotin carboxylase